MGVEGVPELPAGAASPLAEGSPPPSYQSERVKALKKVEPVEIQWERIHLQVPGKGGAKKAVLSDVTGQLRSGCITAIMVRLLCGSIWLCDLPNANYFQHKQMNRAPRAAARPAS
jgi:hypothetical protein